MAIKVGEKDLFPYLGDYGPVSIYKGEQKIAGYKWAGKSGQELHFDNTYNSHVEVEVDGQSYQHAGSGKNLFNVGFPHKDRYISSGGYLIYEANRQTSDYVPVEPNKTYTLSIKDSTLGSIHELSSENSIEIVRRYGNPNTETYTFTTDATTSYIQFTIQTGENAQVQLEEGSTATEYEPPAPTPDYPIEIESVNDFDVVSSAGGRNLLLGSGEYSPISLYANHHITPIETGVEDGIDWVTGYSVSDNGFIISTYIPQRFKSNLGEIYSRELSDYEGAITLSVDVMSEQPLDVALGPSLDDQKKLEPNEWSRIHTTRYGRNTPLGLYANSNPETPVGTKLYWRNYKIEKGTTPTDWTPAPEDITKDSNHPLIDKINLSLSEPLRSVGDVKDRIFKDSNGLWKVERNVGEVVVDGIERKGTWNDYYRYFAIPAPNVRTYQRTTVSNYISNNQESIPTIRNSNDSGTLWVFSDDNWLTNSTDFNEWAKEKNNLGQPLVVQYELNNSTAETLDQELQDQLNTLKSFKGSNYVYTVQNTDNPHKEQLKPTLHAKTEVKDI